MQPSDWFESISHTIDAHAHKGGLLIVLPEYRPDQCTALAHRLQIPCFDYRTEVMSAHGWDADRITLDDLDATLAELASQGACLVNNVEALLSTKDADACEQWLQAFVDTTWHAALLVPIVINADRVPQGHARVVRVTPEQLPEQSFISRLAL